MPRDIFQGFISILGGQAGVVAVSIFITPLLTRTLGSSGYGDYAFLVSTIGILMIVVNAGIFDGIRKYISEPRELEYWESDVFGFYFRLGATLAVVIGGLLVFAVEIGVISQLLGQQFERYFYFVAILLMTNQLSKVARSGLMGFGFEHYSEPLKVVERLIFGLIGVTLAALGFGVGGVLFAYVVSTGTITILALWFLHSHVSYRRIFSRTSVSFPRSELLSFNSLSIVLTGLTTSLYHVDVLLLQPMVGSQQTGYYKIALVAAEFLWLAPFSLQLVLLHSTSEMWANDQRERVTQIATRATRYGLLLTLLLAVGLAALADPFIPLYFGSEYGAAIAPLLLLLPGALGFALARPIFAIGQGKGDLQILIYATGAAALLNLVLNLLLIPQYGMNGAAVATSIGYGSMFVLHVWSARKIGFDPLEDLRLTAIAITAITSAPIIIGLSHLIPNDILALFIVPPVGFLVYMAIALKAGAVEQKHVREISKRLPRRVNRVIEWLS